jgi:hypothetical protein
MCIRANEPEITVCEAITELEKLVKYYLQISYKLTLLRLSVLSF